MRRREFIAMLGSAAVWPIPAGAQFPQSGPPKLPTIGFLNNPSPDQWQPVLSGFRRGLGEAGYVDAQNVTLIYRWTEGQVNRLPDLAADLVRTNVAVIVASADTETALAARTATSKIPVIFAIQDDPVRFGLVSSLDQPGGRATGIYLQKSVAPVDLMRQLLPGNRLTYAMEIFDTSSVAQESDPETAFALMLDSTPSKNPHVIVPKAGAMQINSGPFLDRKRRSQLVSLAAGHGIPALYNWRVFVEEGGLISHGWDIDDVYVQMGRYAGQILRGKDPADLPVQKPTKSETVINLRTAGELGLSVPRELIARADKVIE
jgi:putative ABC transport system substrate-binding protein